MQSITYKIKQKVVAASGIIAGLLLLATVLVPAPRVFADSQSLVLACHPNQATAKVTSSGKVSCSGDTAPEESVYVALVGSDKSKIPTDVATTVVKIDCGKDAVAKYTKNDDISETLKCHTSKTPKVTVTATNALSAKAKAAACSPSDALCSSCANGAGGSAGCPDCQFASCNDPASTPDKDCTREDCDLLQKYVNPAITVFTVSFGLIATISIIAGGLQYSASQGDPQKAAAAKGRLQNTIVAIIAYFFLYGFLQFIVPGGIFNR